MSDADWSFLLRPASRRIIDLLLAGSRTLTELAEATGLAKPSLLPHLKQLTSLGVISRTELRTAGGRATSYQLNAGSIHVEFRESGTVVTWASPGPVPDDFPLVSQVQDQGIRGEILVALRSVRARIPKAMPSLFIVLFGSAAEGKATWKSDIDLLVVMPDEDIVAWENVADPIADIQHLVTHVVRFDVIGRDAFLRGKDKRAKAAAQAGIVIWGLREEVELWRRMERHRSISL